MGMYTELHLNAELKRDVPDEVTDTLIYMLRITSTILYSKQAAGVICSRWIVTTFRPIHTVRCAMTRLESASIFVFAATLKITTAR